MSTVAPRLASGVVDRPAGSIATASGGTGGQTLATATATRTATQSMYCLDVRQQPRQARMAGSGEKADRRTVDPPPIVRLRVRRPPAAATPTRRKSAAHHQHHQQHHGGVDDDLVAPTLTHTHFCFASLVPEHSDEELFDLAGTKSKYVGGSVVASLFHLKDQSCFVFPDLSVRTEGRWRFKMSLFEIVENGVIFCDSVVTDVFQVYSSKRFPGMRQSTELSRSLAQQGLKLRIRRPEPNGSDGDETAAEVSQQPKRKKSKPTPRQRPPASNDSSWSVVARGLDPAVDPAHAIPLVAPIGSTTTTPQQRPWTSWNASPPSLSSSSSSKVAAGHYSSSSSYPLASPAPAPRPATSHATDHPPPHHHHHHQLDARLAPPRQQQQQQLFDPRGLAPAALPSALSPFPTSRPLMPPPLRGGGGGGGGPFPSSFAPPPPPPLSSPPRGGASTQLPTVVLAPIILRDQPEAINHDHDDDDESRRTRPPSPTTTPATSSSHASSASSSSVSAERSRHERGTTARENAAIGRGQVDTDDRADDAKRTTIDGGGNRNSEEAGGGGGGRSGGSLAMLLGDGARDAKHLEHVSFF
ncbi:hypothetical protein JCM11491_000325 [Sporobolomyces phaffii]